MLTRFQLEAEAGLKLQHPNVLRTHAIKQSEDIYGVIHFMVMELVRGVSLFELLQIRRAVLPWPLASDIILQAARGLHYAHELGLVHRDVKPENLLIRSDGLVKVLDFGLAMIRGSEAEFSAATILGQTCLGTADYIAPEQSLDSLEVDRRADLYSLGCTFYFLLAGHPPFPDKSVAKKLDGHRRRRATPVHLINPKVPERLSKIIRKMMARRPENRFESAEQLAKYLEPLAERQPIDFDFEAVLRRRARIAEKRLASESVLRGDSRTTGASRLEWRVQSVRVKVNWFAPVSVPACKYGRPPAPRTSLPTAPQDCRRFMFASEGQSFQLQFCGGLNSGIANDVFRRKDQRMNNGGEFDEAFIRWME
jgi:eukaryotic-like serine/threonine-protein kinase